MEEKHHAVYDLNIADTAEACINKLADINIFITGKNKNKADIFVKNSTR